MWLCCFMGVEFVSWIMKPGNAANADALAELFGDDEDYEDDLFDLDEFECFV